jgi:N6-adenosine-specific RNA methylase IME4
MPDGSAGRPELPVATFHPLADLFPLMEGAEFDLLAADIKANGLREPIVEMDHMILDGRNRYRACNETGVRARYVKYKGSDPLGFVISTNLHRRHLNVSQRAMIAARICNLAVGSNQHVIRVKREGVEFSTSSQVAVGEKARIAGVDRKTLFQAQKVHDKGIPELIKRVEAGEIAVSNAAKVADLPRERQEALADASEAELRGAGKKARRAKRTAELGEKTRAAAKSLGTKLYSVIYADPPWQFEPYSTDTGMDRAADNHYQTMTTEAIEALKVPAAKDAILFLWATAPMLPDALAVMKAWGFTYKSNCIWVKSQAGTGFWYRSKHEILLVGTRGTIPAPAPGEQYSSVITANVGRHSEKPAAFAEMIEEMFAGVPAVEMFARAPRLGWDTWGNEV